MITTLIYAIGLLTGLLAGFYARSLHNMLSDIYNDYMDRKEAQKAGVVKPTVTRGTTRDYAIDLSKGSGVIQKPSPDMVQAERLRQRDEAMKRP